MNFRSFIAERLFQLESSCLLRRPKTVLSPEGPAVTIEGERVLCFCSNDYLGFAGDIRVKEALAQAVERYGAGAGASRLVSGTHPVHRLAEDRLAAFTGCEAALLFSSGYAANVGTLQAVVDDGDLIFSDALNHASIIDGCRLSKAATTVYSHCDLDHLESLLRERRSHGRASLVVTEAVFSMDGDVAPLAELRALCDQYDTWLMVDEAHALGVFGPHGRGLSAACNVKPDIVIGTLGKSFGLCGAFVAGHAELRTFLENRARSFVYSTASLPALAGATVTTVDLVEQAEEARRVLWENATRLRAALHEQGWQVGAVASPILPVYVGTAATALDVSAQLLSRGIFVQAIRPPTVPDGTSRLRVVLTAAHTQAHLQIAIHAFENIHI